MTKLSLTTLLLLFALLGHAQFGYRGKTVYIGYSIPSSIALFSPSYKGPREKFSLNTSHEFSLHKIYRRRREIIGSYSFARTAFDLPLYSYIPLYDGFSSSSTSIPSSPNKLHIHTYSVTYRKYFDGFKRRWHVAPIGPYFDFQPYVSSLTLLYKPSEKTSAQKVKRIMSNGITLGMGRQRVFLDKFTLDLGARVTLPFRIFTLGFLDRDTTSLDTIYENAAIVRTFSKSMFEVKVGIGFLAF